MLAMRSFARLLLLVTVSSVIVSCNRATSTAAAPVNVEASKPDAASALKARPKGAPQPRLPMGTVTILPNEGAPIQLRVEIAIKPRELQQGLMFREHLGEDEGMLFAFNTERRNSFWMQNTLIPLDMFFIDSDWNVVGIVENAEPLTEDSRGVPAMSQYVLEVPGGFAARHRLAAGVKIQFVPPQTLEMP